jgi:hypothetical protein
MFEPFRIPLPSAFPLEALIIVSAPQALRPGRIERHAYPRNRVGRLECQWRGRTGQNGNGAGEVAGVIRPEEEGA